MPVPAATVVPEAGLIVAASGTQAPAVNAAAAAPAAAAAAPAAAAPAAAAAPPVSAAVREPAGLGVQDPAVSAAAPAGQAVAPHIDPDIHANNAITTAAAAPLAQAAVVAPAHGQHHPPLSAAAAVPHAGLMLLATAALAQAADLGLPIRTLVNPAGTGPVPFVIRRHASGVCGIKLSEQHQQNDSNLGAGSCSVPRLQDMMRAVNVSTFIRTPTPGDVVSALSPQMAESHTSLGAGNLSLA